MHKFSAKYGKIRDDFRAAVSERLGHSSVPVAATIYSHRITGRNKEAAKKWDAFQKAHEQPGQKR